MIFYAIKRNNPIHNPSQKLCDYTAWMVDFLTHTKVSLCDVGILKNEWNTACTLLSMIVISTEDCGDKQKLMNMWEYCWKWYTVYRNKLVIPQKNINQEWMTTVKRVVPKQLSETNFGVSLWKLKLPAQSSIVTTQVPQTYQFWHYSDLGSEVICP